MRVPGSTYRLQLTDEFTLADARDIVPYLAQLGITDLYLSPVFEARPGSSHGYDVTDPTRIRASLGGEAALRELSAAVQRHDMGILLDIVPNHMAASSHNPWWRDLLEHGRRSQFAHFFDVDWERGRDGRIRLPILGDTLERVLERGEIDVDIDTHEVVYHATRLPAAVGSLGAADVTALGGAGRTDALRRILDRQHYELADWRSASVEMNYRRFFDITDLAGVRVEESDVFNATHELIRQLAADGVITGLRIDHVDGLRDPAGYLNRLRERVRGPAGEPVYTVVEKILERDERLPDDWACEGTTGYEFLTLATGLLVEPGGHERIEAFYGRLAGGEPFGELVRRKKLLVLGRLFGSELNALARGLAALTGVDEETARHAVAEVTASMNVYRTYARSRQLRAEDRARITAAVTAARARRPELEPGFRAFCRVALLERAPVTDEELDWVLRWQQFTGPVMAKGFEDTALYCHNALLAANDVGSDPVRPALAAAALHDALRDRSGRPRSLNATATHDTKRGEDTRARIAVLSELPDEWRDHLRRWIRRTDEWKSALAEEEDTAVPDADVDSLLYQTLLGAWPLDGVDDAFTDRIKQYMLKAVREAKEQTSWRRPDEDYEQAVDALVEFLMQQFGRRGVAEDVAEFARRLAPHGAINSLAQLLLKITAPGIPDIYQGTELWSHTLVDPDNRRPVDYALRKHALDAAAQLLAEPRADAVRSLLTGWEDGRIKLVITALALRCRNANRDLFDRGEVRPLRAEGPRAEHIFAFARSLGDDACVVVLPRWTARLAREPGTLPDSAAWEGTVLRLDPPLRTSWRNVLTGETLPAGETLDVARLYAAVPFALLA